MIDQTSKSTIRRTATQDPLAAAALISGQTKEIERLTAEVERLRGVVEAVIRSYRTGRDMGFAIEHAADSIGDGKE